MRRLPANDLCVLGATDCNPAVHGAKVQRRSLHVSQKGAVRLRYQVVSVKQLATSSKVALIGDEPLDNLNQRL